MLPVAFKYFIEQYETMGVSPALRIGDYFTFFFRMVLAFGVTFELPVIHVGVGADRRLGLSFYAAIVSLCDRDHFCARCDVDADA